MNKPFWRNFLILWLSQGFLIVIALSVRGWRPIVWFVYVIPTYIIPVAQIIAYPLIVAFGLQNSLAGLGVTASVWAAIYSLVVAYIVGIFGGRKPQGKSAVLREGPGRAQAGLRTRRFQLLSGGKRAEQPISSSYAFCRRLRQFR